MARVSFAKRALPTKDLIRFLEEKGLIIRDKVYAEHCLNYIGYYRLKIYMRAFQTSGKFSEGTTFSNIVNIYNFDRELRLLCLDPIERIEVSLRAHIINVMGARGGPHFFNNDSFFAQNHRESAKSIIKKTIEKNPNNLPIKHYKSKYSIPVDPAIWCITESSTFGSLSRFYGNLEIEYKKEIAKGFGLNYSMCESWFKCLSTLRNICAHHGRLWNMRLVVNNPKKPRNYSEHFDNEKIYSRLTLLKIMLDNIDKNGGYGWAPRLIEFINERPQSIRLDAMGFPEKWSDSEVWKHI